MQDPKEDICPSGGTAKQNNAISILQGAIGTAFLIHYLHLSHQALYLLGDGQCLRLNHDLLAPVILEFRRFPIHQKQLRLGGLLPRGKAGACMEGGGIIIDQPPQILRHQAAEEKINRIQDPGPTPEVLVQVNPPAGRPAAPLGIIDSLLSLSIPEAMSPLVLMDFLRILEAMSPLILMSSLRTGNIIGMIFFQEKLGARHTETIDGLLDISHHKAVVDPPLSAGDCLQKVFLDVVAVLVFIRHDLIILI